VTDEKLNLLDFRHAELFLERYCQPFPNDDVSQSIRTVLAHNNRLREQQTALLEVKRVCAWAELLMREVAPEVAAEMRKAIEGAK
jgi:hypothetical protein